MTTIGNSNFTWLEFQKDGSIGDQAINELKGLLAKPDVTDLVVISHGWKNAKEDAFNLYSELWQNVSNALPASRTSTMVVAGVAWPSKAYRTDFDEATMVVASQGGAQSHGTAAPIGDLGSDNWDIVLSDFRELMGPAADELIEAANRTADELTKNNAFSLVKSGTALVFPDPTNRDVELSTDVAGVVQASQSEDQARDAILFLAAPPVSKLNESTASGQSLSSTINSLVSGPRAAVARFLNQLTYFEMKKRAGIVGVSLARNVLANLRPTSKINLHLIGHSFGARLVTAAVNEDQDFGQLVIFSLTLLQGAFSHNGLAGTFQPGLAGAFPNVVGKAMGPIAITHTHNDLACTVAYPLASRLSRDTTQALGDRNDMFGAMGANGPQHLAAEILAVNPSATAFKPEKRKVNAFLADDYIIKTDTVDAHNNVANSTVGELVASVLKA